MLKPRGWQERALEKFAEHRSLSFLLDATPGAGKTIFSGFCFKQLLEQHVELYEALLRLNCRRLRLMFDQIEDLNTRPLQARLAKQILLLARSYGVAQGEEIRIGLALAQEDLAQLLGASRQRVNQELKGFEREGAVRVEPTRLVVLSREKLMAIAER